MAESKYGQYIITDLKPKIKAPWSPQFTDKEITPLRFLDSSIIKGAFYVECNWTLPAFADHSRGEAHQHDFDEVIAFFGSNPDDPENLNAILEVPLGDEVHTVTKSCLIFIPKGLKHGPFDFKKIDRPIFHFASGTGNIYF